MNRKFETTFATLCIAAALGAALFVTYRILSQDAAGREAAKADFEGLRSVLAYVKSPSDLADPGLRARLASRYEASPGLVLVDVYERGGGDRWRIPAESPYLDESSRAGAAPKSSYPPASTLLLSAPLKGDSTGKLALDALYVSLPQAAAFGAFRDALIGLGAFLAVAAFVLAIVMGGRGKKRPEATFDFSSQGPEAASASDSPSKPRARKPEAAKAPAAPTAQGRGSEAVVDEESFDEEWEAEAKAAARYQFETLEAESEGVVPGLSLDEEFDIPIMDMESVAEEEEESGFADSRERSAFAETAAAAQVATPSATPSTAANTAAKSTATAAAAAPENAEAEAKTEAQARDEGPAGLFSPASGLGWESYMKERLDAEISRSASFEQDLSLLVFSYDGLTSQDEAYLELGKAIKGFFSFRDLSFERGDDGFSVILPNIDSAHALRMADEFYKKLVFLAEGDFAELDLMPVFMGISSRAGRLVDAKRLIDEAMTALDRTRYEKDTHIVAFRPDPDKYRQFLASKA